MIKYVVKDSDK